MYGGMDVHPFAQILAETLQPGGKEKIGKGKDGKEKTERRLIVLKDRDCYRQCLAHLNRLGVQPVKKLKSIHAVSCHFPKHANLKKLESHPLVKRVEIDARFRIHAAPASLRSRQVTPWGIRRVLAPSTWPITQGQGIKVAVIDTGISRHPDLRIAGSFNAVNRGKPAVDYNGHGTHVAGTIAALNNTFGVVGVAPRIRLYNVKAFRKDGSANLSDIIEGIDW